MPNSSNSNYSALFPARGSHGTHLSDAGGGTSSRIRARVVHPSHSTPEWIRDSCRDLTKAELSHLVTAPADGSMDFGLSLELRLPMDDVADMRQYLQKDLADSLKTAGKDGR